MPSLPQDSTATPIPPSSSSSVSTSYQQQQSQQPPQRPMIPKAQFLHELSHCLEDFVVQLLPTHEEIAVKEDVRKLLERLIRTIEPESRLLSFGSTANGFSLRNSDMDLCCLIDSKDHPDASQLVQMTGELLERETKFLVKPLPHARIPIVKLSLNPSPGLPFGIACDIGFENRLALENTRLLMSYAAIDPLRVRTMVLFLKVWSKRRKINSPYRGTLSSYGYVLLVVYFLVHVKNPPVLPNLQQIPPMRPINYEDTHLNGRNIWFFDDIELLRQRWISANEESVAELLIDFFRYFSKDFLYNTGVASIRAGLVKKESKGWLHEGETRGGRYTDLAQTRNKLCIEDPFEIDYNVARSVTRDGLYIIRGEFMRAHRLLMQRSERPVITIAQLCEERPDDLPAPASTPLFVGPSRLAPIPAQTPYSVGGGSQELRPNEGGTKKDRDRLSPPLSFLEGPRLTPNSHHNQNQSHEAYEHGAGTISKTPTTPVSGMSAAAIGEPGPSSLGSSPHAGPSMSTSRSTGVIDNGLPEHMAPKRSKWTSPPPPNADVSDVASFEDRFELGLEMATQSWSAREPERPPIDMQKQKYASSDTGTSDVNSSDIETNPDDYKTGEGDGMSELGFVDARSVASYSGHEEPRSRYTTVHASGTRTPPISSHTIPLQEPLPLQGANATRSHSRQARSSRIYQTQLASPIVTRAASDSGHEGGSSTHNIINNLSNGTNSRRYSRDDSLLLHPSSASDRNATIRSASTSTPRPHTSKSQMASSSSSLSSTSSYQSYQVPPRIQSNAVSSYIGSSYPLFGPYPTLHPLAPYTMYQPAMSNRGHPVVMPTGYTNSYFSQNLQHMSTQRPPARRSETYSQSSSSPPSTSGRPGTASRSAQSSPSQPHAGSSEPGLSPMATSPLEAVSDDDRIPSIPSSHRRMQQTQGSQQASPTFTSPVPARRKHSYSVGTPEAPSLGGRFIPSELMHRYSPSDANQSSGSRPPNYPPQAPTTLGRLPPMFTHSLSSRRVSTIQTESTPSTQQTLDGLESNVARLHIQSGSQISSPPHPDHKPS